MAKIQNHVVGTVDNLRDSDGNVHEINAAYFDGKGAEKYTTTDTEQNISAKKTFDATPVLSKIKSAKVVGTNASGLMEAHTLGIDDIANLQADLEGKAPKSHSHAISDVTNLQTSLDGKASKSDVDSINSQITFLEKYTKVYYVDTNITISDNHGTPINSKFESNVETISSDMSTNFNSYPTNQCIYAERVGDITPNELTLGDIIVIDGYLSRYVSDKTTVSTSSGGQASVIRVKFTAINKQYLDRINGKANASHTHSISQITNLQTTLNNKQDKIEYPCSFDASGGGNVKISREGTDNYCAFIQHGSIGSSDSSTYYPAINVSFPYSFNGVPTVVATFSPSSNSTGAVEAIKVVNVTSTGFFVTTKMSAAVSSGYFRVK